MPDDVYMFSYTSGTTGDPKGVKLTHKMMLCQALAVNTRASKKFDYDDCVISYLPSAHSYDQCVTAVSIMDGMKIGFYAGDHLKLSEDMQVLKPTLFPSVPRLFNRMYDKIKKGVAEQTGIKSWLVNKGINSKLQYLKNGEGITHKIYDPLIFNKFKTLFGGNLRLMISASAPIAPDVLVFLKICFSCDILEGYGMTETSGASTLMFEGDPHSGICGGPL